MAFRVFSSCGLFLIIWASFLFFREANAAQAPSHHVSVPFNRTGFPPNFIFGAASSAYQYEGAAFEDGRGPSICDTFVHNHPVQPSTVENNHQNFQLVNGHGLYTLGAELILDHSTGDVADDFYHRYKDDVQLMKFIGMNGFRFSISWSRVLPHGKLTKGVNKLGIAFYNNLINELLAKGITPFVTLFHWDPPQALEDEYGGFRNISIVNDFRDFAEVCFREFGDRVKHWTTFNEPWSFSTGGYDSTTFIGSLAPGRCSKWMNKCTAGDTSTEPYLVAHHIILSHATTARLYRKKYKPTQKGNIGIVLVTNWMSAYNPKSKADIMAAKRGLDFYLGWFLDPLTYGDYPACMRKNLGDRLPKFTAQESRFIKGTLDILGLNYYTSNYCIDIPTATTVNTTYNTDVQVQITSIRNGKPIGEPTGAGFLYVYPQGLTRLLVYVKENYKNPTIYITENGLAEFNIDTIKEGVNDTKRVQFYLGHFRALKKAIELGVDVKGFFAWSFLDTYEWGSGYKVRFGLNFVDWKNGLKRYPKKSAFWLKQFLLN